MKKGQMTGLLGDMLGEEVIRLTQQEIDSLRRAQKVVEKIRDHIDDEDSDLDMACAQIEHGVSELLDELLDEHKELRL